MHYYVNDLEYVCTKCKPQSMFQIHIQFLTCQQNFYERNAGVRHDWSDAYQYCYGVSDPGQGSYRGHRGPGRGWQEFLFCKGVSDN